MPGAAVRLEMSGNPKCKTKYDLVMVYKCELAGARLLHLADAKLLGSLKSSLETPLLRKRGLGWVNMDSQAPNKVVGEWLSKQEFGLVRREFTYGKSRIDFYMEKGEQKYLLEVKGCTLEVGGIGYFPDAPTERDVKHLHELAFDHVSFGYDDRQVLRDVSFTIPEKTSTAIVGPSSSGKTTLCFAVQCAEDLLRKVERVVFALLVGQARIRSKIFQRQGIFLCQRAGGS